MMKQYIKTTCMSNTLEWFDFALFIFMAPIIGEHFFPQQAPHLATQEALLVFAVGFICRPLGGIIFGHYGDTRGRAKVLRYSTLLITLSTLFVGLLPSYHTIGIAATILFIALRLAQGFSIGGEYSGALIYLTESADPKKRGFTTSFAAVGANIGFLLATLSFILLKMFCSSQALHDWCWRLPFIFTGLPGVSN
jgi:MHS family proline/betaine transporter-like MFS transporter